MLFYKGSCPLLESSILFSMYVSVLAWIFELESHRAAIVSIPKTTRVFWGRVARLNKTLSLRLGKISKSLPTVHWNTNSSKDMCSSGSVELYLLDQHLKGYDVISYVCMYVCMYVYMYQGSYSIRKSLNCDRSPRKVLEFPNSTLPRIA